MPEVSKDLAQQAIATANRLRQIQADFADHGPQTREGYLSDEVDRVLSTLVPDQRQPFLEALRDHFPTWDANILASAESGESGASQSPTDQREWNDVHFVLERLVELAKPLPGDQRKKLANRLAGAGIATGEGVAVSPELIDELKSCLQVDVSDAIDSTRLLEMSVMLVRFAYSLDQLIWQIWKNIAPKSKLRSTGLQNTMKRFTKGDSDVSLTSDLEHLRHLVASLLSSISQIGVQFGQQHLAKFAPQEIEASAAMEPGGFLVAKEVKCWRKYTELAKSFDDPSAIDSQVKQIIADFVEAMPAPKR